jgi:hypothetical protein
LQISLHLRGGATPLVIAPKCRCWRARLGVGCADARDRDRVTIPPGRSQAILLAVSVADTDFWDSLTRGADQIRYEPLLGAMRVHFADEPGLDLLALERDGDSRCVPLRLALPEGATMEQALARRWRSRRASSSGISRKTPASGRGQADRLDPVGSCRRRGARAARWRILRFVATAVPAESTEIGAPVVRAALGRPAAASVFASAASPPRSRVRGRAGVAALREYGSCAGVPQQVIVTLRSQLDGTLGSTIPEEYRGPLFTTLAEAQRLAGDLESARANWERAAKYGDAQAILALANQALELPTRAAEGVRKLRQAAAAGSSEALTRLADVEQREGGDARRALLLIGQAAQAGYAPALTTLGQRYESGDGLPRDTQQAAELYRAAARRGDVAAMLRLGMLHETGQGLPLDLARASAWYRAAATGVPWEEQP